MSGRLRFVFDTNVFISTVLVSNGKAQQAFIKADQNGYYLLSAATLEELRDVLYREKFDKYITDAERTRFLADLLEKSAVIPITESITVCRDPDDDKFLELAVSGNADYLVSGDDDLLALHPFRAIPILRPAEFLNVELRKV